MRLRFTSVKQFTLQRQYDSFHQNWSESWPGLPQQNHLGGVLPHRPVCRRRFFPIFSQQNSSQDRQFWDYPHCTSELPGLEDLNVGVLENSLDKTSTMFSGSLIFSFGKCCRGDISYLLEPTCTKYLANYQMITLEWAPGWLLWMHTTINHSIHWNCHTKKPLSSIVGESSFRSSPVALPQGTPLNLLPQTKLCRRLLKGGTQYGEMNQHGCFTLRTIRTTLLSKGALWKSLLKLHSSTFSILWKEMPT